MRTIQEGELRQIPPEIDLASTIPQAKAGDPLATEALVGYLQPKLLGYFIRRLPEEAEDLTQETLLTITHKLPKFKMEGHGDVAISFRAWSFAIARIRLAAQRRINARDAQVFVTPQVSEEEIGSYDEQLSHMVFRLQRQRGEGEVETETDEPETTLAELVPQFHDRLAEVLTPLQLDVVERRMQGKSIDDVLIETGIARDSLMARFQRARQKIEEQIIYPAGFRRVADYGDDAPPFTASGGQLQAVLFLGLYYTSAGFVLELQPRRKSVDQSFLEQGYVLLIKHATPAEYASLTKIPQYRQYVKLHRGRLYILPKDLAEVRMYLPTTNRPEPPREGLVELVQYAKTEEERGILIRAVGKGLIKVERGARGHFFVEPEDMERYQQTQQEKAKSSTEQKPATRNISAEPARLPDSSVILFIEGAGNEQVFFEAFSQWFFTVVKHASNRKLPLRKRKRMGYQEIPDIDERISRDLHAWLETRGAKFPDYIEATVSEVLKGEKTSLIPEKLHYSRDGIIRHISQARRLIEGTLLTPAGIKKVSSYKRPMLQQIVKLGRLEGIWFFGRWYTTDDRVELYDKRVAMNKERKVISPEELPKEADG